MFERPISAKGARKMSDMGLEAPDADAAEQDLDAIPGDEDKSEAERLDVPLEANLADASEQARSLGPDDEEYR
jgi:hypothetical protein